MVEIKTSIIFRLFSFTIDYRVFFSDVNICMQKGNVPQEIHFSTIVSKPTRLEGLIWDRIGFQTIAGETFSISGIPKRLSASSLEEFTKAISEYHLQKIRPAYQQIESSVQLFKSILQNKYVKHSVVEKWRSENKYLSGACKAGLSLDFLSEDKCEPLRKYLSVYSRCQEIRETQNEKFINAELKKFSKFFDAVENNPLTERQRLACVVNEDNNLIIAGAGSGKTSVIIAKAGYLIESGLAKPQDLLILAYGRKASKETDERIQQKLPDVEGVTTSTFHKLGLDIIGFATGKKPRVSKMMEDPAEFYSLVNRMVTELTKRDALYSQRIIEYFVTYLIPYKDEFSYKQQGEYFSALKEWDIKSLKSRVEFAEIRTFKKSLRQEQLRSFEEVVIADFLFVNRIEYIYEHPYKINTASQEKTQYHPDFYLPEYEIYIEHFGISREGKTPPFVDQISYVQGIEWKRELHRQHGTRLVETYSYEMQEGTLTDLLHSKLEKFGVSFNPLSFQELLELLAKVGEEKKASQFTRLVVTFLELFKQSGFSFENLRLKADRHPEKPRCHAFIDVFEPIFDEYTAELRESGTIDFSDMIRKGADLVRSGQYKSPYKYILVDEFQDISSIRADLVKALIDSVDDSSLACVGDDWQSIYRFTGSDISYTMNFEQYFGYTKKVALDKTFRFNDKINAFATRFITLNPAQIKKDVQSVKSVPSNAVTLVQYFQDVDQAVLHCVEEIRHVHPASASIYVLGRYSFSKPAFLQTMAKQYPQYEFLFDTVHGSKGKEADFVIVVDLNDGKYGFPSKIANDPLLELVLPNSEPLEYAEERRLFYVAITRAKHHSFILYSIEKPSVFIKEIQDGKDGKYLFNEISTEGVKSAPPDFGICASCGTGKIAMRVMPDGQFFFGCGNYPFCRYTPKTCNCCSKYPLIKSGSLYKCLNSECGNVAKACRQCSDGVMVQRSGRYGTFLGCSNYGKTRCNYTEKIMN